MPLAFEDKMQDGDVDAEQNSSSSISPPPDSPPPNHSLPSDTIRVSNLGGGVINSTSASASNSVQPSTNLPTTTSNTTSTNGTAADKPKKTRKKKVCSWIIKMRCAQHECCASLLPRKSGMHVSTQIQSRSCSMHKLCLIVQHDY